MAEIEVGGITFKGGKMFAVAMALGSPSVFSTEDLRSTKTIKI